MRHSFSDELPPDLLRQLEAIERSANALEHANGANWDDQPQTGARTLKLVATPRHHALDVELRRARRESLRVRKLTVVFLILGVLLAVGGSLAHRLGYFYFGLVLLGLGGTLIGLGAVSAYYANSRIQELTREGAAMKMP